MAGYYNIEYKRFATHSYRVGYTAKGATVRIYGDTRSGYSVHGKPFRTLAQVSKHLETI